MNARNQRERGGNSSSTNGSEFDAQRNLNAPNSTSTTNNAAAPTSTASFNQMMPQTSFNQMTPQTTSRNIYFVAAAHVNGAQNGHIGQIMNVNGRRNAVGNIFDGLDTDQLDRLRTTTMVGAYNELRI